MTEDICDDSWLFKKYREFKRIVKNLKEENRRLRETLKIYGNKNNWCDEVPTPLPSKQFISPWSFDAATEPKANLGYHPWLIAQEALDE